MDRKQTTPLLRVALPLFWLAAASLSAAVQANAQTIAAGKMIEVRLERSLTTKSAGPGDAITARVAATLKDMKNVVVPSGSLIQGRVDFVQKKSTTQDGWIRLIFDRVDLPDGREIPTLASGSFAMQRSKGKKARLLMVGGFAAIGALLGGSEKRVAAGLGGAIIGMVIFENKNRYGKDLTLPAGKTLQLRLSDDIVKPAQD